MRLSCLVDYGDAAYLPAVADSLLAAGFRRADTEILIPVRSGDGAAAAVAAGYGDAVRPVAVEAASSPAARHAAMAAAAGGDYLATFDPAHLALPLPLDSLLASLDGNPAVAVLYGFHLTGPEPSPAALSGLPFSAFFFPSDASQINRGGMFLRRTAVLAAGNYREHPAGADAFLLLRLLGGGSIAFHAAVHSFAPPGADRVELTEDAGALREAVLALDPALSRSFAAGEKIAVTPANRLPLSLLVGVHFQRAGEPERQLELLRIGQSLQGDDHRLALEAARLWRESGKTAELLAECLAVYPALEADDPLLPPLLELAASGCRELGRPAERFEAAAAAEEERQRRQLALLAAPLARLADAYPEPRLRPAFPERNVPVIFSTDEGYVPYLAVALASLLEHMAPERCYDIIILHETLGTASRRTLAGLAAGRENCRLRFLNVGGMVRRLEVSLAHGRYGAAACYRLLLPELLPDYDRVIYLDCDLVALSDVAPLFDLELGDCWLGAIRDFGTRIEVRRNEVQREYFINELKMRNLDDYLQSGVLAMNLAQCRRDRASVRWIDRLREMESPLWPDQDVLNAVSGGRVVYIDQAWNFAWFVNPYEDVLPPDDPLRLEYEQAARSIRILHYVSGIKPWHFTDRPLAEHFWRYAAKTPYLRWLQEHVEYNKLPPGAVRISR